MKIDQSFQKVVGWLAIVAGVLAFSSLLVGLVGVSWDFEQFSEPAALISIGAAGAGFIGWSFWFNMFGNYLLLLPLALWLYLWLKAEHESGARLYTLGGIFYILLGAAGAAILAAAYPFLIEAYGQTTVEAEQALLLADLRLVQSIAEAGLQGVGQNFAGAVWLIGMGTLLRKRINTLGLFSIVIGGFLVLNTLGNMFNVEALSLLGLTGTILLAPLWSILLGALCLRAKDVR